MARTRQVYGGISAILGAIAAIATFIGAYIHFIASYGLLLGFGLGWMPSGILAAIVFFGVYILWGPALILLVLWAIFSMARH